MFTDPLSKFRLLTSRPWFLEEDDGAGSGTDHSGATGDGDDGDEGGDSDGANATGSGGSGTDLTAEVAKWKSLARKHEDQAKRNAKAAKELEQLKRSQMDENEKAIAEAEERGRQAARLEVAEKLAAAEIKAELKGVVDDPAAIVEDLNLRKYVTDDGEVDSDAVAQLREKFSKLAKSSSDGGNSNGSGAGTGKGGPDLRQGVRGGNRPAQLTRDDLKNMTPDEIAKAKSEGRLNDLLGITS